MGIIRDMLRLMRKSKLHPSTTQDKLGECHQNCPFLTKGTPGYCDLHGINLWTRSTWTRGMMVAKQYFTPTLCAFAIKPEKEPKMDALKLDTDAIRERMSKAVVVKHKDGHLDIALPHNGGWMLLVNGGWNHDLPGGFADWVIRPGDECEMSDDGENWVKNVFKGMHWSTDQEGIAGSVFATGNYPFMGAGAPYTFIRPVQTCPKKVRLQESADRMEKELAELNRRIEQID